MSGDGSSSRHNEMKPNSIETKTIDKLDDDVQAPLRKRSLELMQQLPEANPLMQPSKPQDMKPRILISDYKYTELPNILNSNVETEFQEPAPAPVPVPEEAEETIEQQQPPQVQQETELPAPQQKIPKKCQLTLYEKYELSKQYTKVYSRYKQAKSVEECQKNFAGMFINLNCIVDFNSSKFMTFESHRTNSKDYYEKQFDLHKIIQLEKLADHAKLQDQISFTSRFESGNLLSVYTKSINKEYDLVLQNDTNSKGYAQWFFFEVKNYMFKDLTVTFNIVNLTKGGSMFNQGMRPAVFSLKEHEATECGWLRQGKNITVQKNTTIKESDPGQYYDTLSFSYTFEHEIDEVYFAMNIPYSYTKMIDHITTAIPEAKAKYPNLQNKYFPSSCFQKYPLCHRVATKDTLCHSICNNALPILSITEKSHNVGESEKEQLKNTQKKTVWIIARQHPGETVSSFIMEGVINYILGMTPEAVYLRTQFVFKIIPMMNPDGVIYGNFRCNLAGFDINRQWLAPSKVLHPCVYHAKKAILQSRDDGMRMDCFIDLHGHSKKMNTFIYACRREDDYISCRLFPAIFSRISDKFSFKDCTFQLEEYKESAARIMIWNDVNRPKELYFECINIFTLETSFFGYRTSKKIIHFQMKHLREIGADLIRSVYMNNKGEDRILYPKISKKEIQEQMHENILQFMEKTTRDSGSDSDPQAGELDIDEKLGNIIPMKAAKKLGLQIKTTSQSSSQSSNIQPNSSTLKDRFKRKSPRKLQTGGATKTPTTTQTMYSQVYTSSSYVSSQLDQKNQTIFKSRSISRGGPPGSGVPQQRILFNLPQSSKRSESLSSSQVNNSSSTKYQTQIDMSIQSIGSEFQFNTRSQQTNNTNQQIQQTPNQSIRRNSNTDLYPKSLTQSQHTPNPTPPPPPSQPRPLSVSLKSQPKKLTTPPKHFLEDEGSAARPIFILSSPPDFPLRISTPTRPKKVESIASSPSPTESLKLNEIEIMASLLKFQTQQSVGQINHDELEPITNDTSQSNGKRNSIRKISSKVEDLKSPAEPKNCFTNETLERLVSGKNQKTQDSSQQQQILQDKVFHKDEPSENETPKQSFIKLLSSDSSVSNSSQEPLKSQGFVQNNNFYQFLNQNNFHKNLKTSIINSETSKLIQSSSIKQDKSKIPSTTILSSPPFIDSPIRARILASAQVPQNKSKFSNSILDATPTNPHEIEQSPNVLDNLENKSKQQTTHHLPTSSFPVRRDNRQIRDMLNSVNGLAENNISLTFTSGYYDAYFSEKKYQNFKDGNFLGNTSMKSQSDKSSRMNQDGQPNIDYGLQISAFTPFQIDQKLITNYSSPQRRSDINQKRIDPYHHNQNLFPSGTPLSSKPESSQGNRQNPNRITSLNDNEVSDQSTSFAPQRAYSLYQPSAKRVPSQVTVRSSNNEDQIAPRNIRTSAQKERIDLNNSVKVAQVNLNYNTNHLQAANLPNLEQKQKQIIREKSQKYRGSPEECIELIAQKQSYNMQFLKNPRNSSAVGTSFQKANSNNRPNQPQFQTLLE